MVQSGAGGRPWARESSETGAQYVFEGNLSAHRPALALEPEAGTECGDHLAIETGDVLRETQPRQGRDDRLERPGRRLHGAPEKPPTGPGRRDRSTCCRAAPADTRPPLRPAPARRCPHP